MCGCSVLSDPSRPNIVMILADDLGWSQLGCYGSSYYSTANIDRIAAEGMQFYRAYAAAAVCSPTRASIMTGKYPARLHLTDFIKGNIRTDYPLLQPAWQKFLPLEEVTAAELFKEKGYRTAIFGKWHLSQEKKPPGSLPYNPDKQGFDEYVVTYKPEPTASPDKDAHNVDSITRLAVDFIKRNINKPFFLVLSHNTIHDPLMEKEAVINEYRSKYGAGRKENNPVIGAMIDRMDQSVGTILDEIENQGLKTRTIVIFFSDNGGKEAYALQTPLRKGKGWLYEGGIRVPLIISWPEKIVAGSKSNAMVGSIDILPTLADLSSIPMPPGKIDGESFKPVLLSGKKTFRSTMYWHYPHYHQGSGMMPGAAVISENYKMIEWFEKSLTRQEGAFELYDLDHDISESVNLADSLPGKVEQLRYMVEYWRFEMNAQMPVSIQILFKKTSSCHLSILISYEKNVLYFHHCICSRSAVMHPFGTF